MSGSGDVVDSSFYSAAPIAAPPAPDLSNLVSVPDFGSQPQASEITVTGNAGSISGVVYSNFSLAGVAITPTVAGNFGPTASNTSNTNQITITGHTSSPVYSNTPSPLVATFAAFTNMISNGVPIGGGASVSVTKTNPSSGAVHLVNSAASSAPSLFTASHGAALTLTIRH